MIGQKTKGISGGRSFGKLGGLAPNVLCPQNHCNDTNTNQIVVII